MPNPPKKLTPELEAKWAKKLAKSGFVDIEDSLGRLNTYSSGDFLAMVEGERDSFTTLRYDSQERYFQLAGQFLHDHKFTSTKERAIWEDHSNGYSYREIETRLKKRNFKVYKDLINQVVVKLRKVMLDNGQD